MIGTISYRTSKDAEYVETPFMGSYRELLEVIREPASRIMDSGYMFFVPIDHAPLVAVLNKGSLTFQWHDNSLDDTEIDVYFADASSNEGALLGGWFLREGEVSCSWINGPLGDAITKGGLFIADARSGRYAFRSSLVNADIKQSLIERKPVLIGLGEDVVSVVPHPLFRLIEHPEELLLYEDGVKSTIAMAHSRAYVECMKARHPVNAA